MANGRFFMFTWDQKAMCAHSNVQNDPWSILRFEVIPRSHICSLRCVNVAFGRLCMFMGGTKRIHVLSLWAKQLSLQAWQLVDFTNWNEHQGRIHAHFREQKGHWSTLHLQVSVAESIRHNLKIDEMSDVESENIIIFFVSDPLTLVPLRDKSNMIIIWIEIDLT